ncbi:MAG TPA: hypothetical protein VF326_05160 [Anaerolineaceae bacterium]
MAKQGIFAGLIFDENDHQVPVTYVGDEPCYVVDDGGFLRHIPAEQVDRQIFEYMQNQIKGHEDLISQETAKMMGQEDIFTKAIIQNQLKNINQQFNALSNPGIPEHGRAYLGMMGFRIIINVHGEVLEVKQPGSISNEDE